MNIKAILTASTLSVIAGCGLIAPPVQAAGCYSALAASDIHNVILGGGTAKQAVGFAISKGNLNSQMCLLSTKGAMMQYGMGSSVRQLNAEGVYVND